MKFTVWIELPVEIEYIYEPPEKDVGFAGGIVVESAVPVLDMDSLEEICLAHWQTEQEEKKALMEDYYDSLRQTQLIIDQYNAELDRNAKLKRKVKFAR